MLVLLLQAVQCGIARRIAKLRQDGLLRFCPLTRAANGTPVVSDGPFISEADIPSAIKWAHGKGVASSLESIGELGFLPSGRSSQIFNPFVRDLEASAVVHELQLVTHMTLAMRIFDDGLQACLVRCRIALPQPFPHSSASLYRLRDFPRRRPQQRQHFEQVRLSRPVRADEDVQPFHRQVDTVWPEGQNTRDFQSMKQHVGPP